MWAKENWLGGDVRAACEVLKHTFMRNSESEQIWLAAIKFEAVNRESAYKRPTGRVLMQGHCSRKHVWSTQRAMSIVMLLPIPVLFTKS
jgi:hypothetical protein